MLFTNIEHQIEKNHGIMYHHGPGYYFHHIRFISYTFWLNLLLGASQDITAPF